MSFIYFLVVEMRIAKVSFVEKSQLKVISSQNYNSTCLDQACKGTVVNRALSSLHRRSLELTLFLQTRIFPTKLS